MGKRDVLTEKEIADLREVAETLRVVVKANLSEDKPIELFLLAVTSLNKIEGFLSRRGLTSNSVLGGRKRVRS